MTLGEYYRQALSYLNPLYAGSATDDLNTLADRLVAMADEAPDAIPALLIKAAIALPSEAGEFAGLVDKVAFQHLPLDRSMRAKMILELGDVCWCFALACYALGISPRDVLAANIAKLKARFPDGEFSTAARQAEYNGVHTASEVAGE